MLTDNLITQRQLDYIYQLNKKIGAGYKSRTRDLLITNQLLYQLS